jgi:hypothetical protein
VGKESVQARAAKREIPSLAILAWRADLKKGTHVLVERSLVTSTYEQPSRKGKNADPPKIMSWSVRADVVRSLNRDEPEPQAVASGSAALVN